MPEFQTLNYPQAKGEIMAFVRAHHYSRRSPGVWTCAHVIVNDRGKIQAVCLNGQPPYPGIARRLVKSESLVPNVSWQARLIAKGITSAQLDALLRYSNDDLYQRGLYFNYTMTDPQAWVIDGLPYKLWSPGFSGHVYARNEFYFLGYTEPSRAISLWLIDGRPIHQRQGAVTITRDNVRRLFPEAKTIRFARTGAKARFAYVLAANERERAQRMLLLNFQARPWQPVSQPRLLFGNLFLQLI